MSNLLKEIIARRRADVKAASRKIPLQRLQQKIGAISHHRSLINQLRHHANDSKHACIIAETKKASPSAGLLCQDYEPARIARKYEQAGAIAISVLTEPHYFLGSDDDLRKVRGAVTLPVLRKDFICDPYQVYESAALGADVILLIAAALDIQLLQALYKLAYSLNLEVIIEVHTKLELENVLDFKDAVLGINNRDLDTLKTDISVARELAAYIPQEHITIAESGIKTVKYIKELQEKGYNGFLIGESLLKSGNISGTLKKLIK